MSAGQKHSEPLPGEGTVPPISLPVALVCSLVVISLRGCRAKVCFSYNLNFVTIERMQQWDSRFPPDARLVDMQSIYPINLQE
jgi:hypothetical protein